MASRFTALQLPAGEAFLLQTEHAGRACVILVDSGTRAGRGGHHPLATAIKNVAPDLRRIDIAVCTHQDRDHAGGFQNFADIWYSEGHEIGEYWLPGRWAPAVPGVLQDPAELVSQIWSGSQQLASNLPDRKQGNRKALSLDDRLRAAAQTLDAAFRFELVENLDEHPGSNDSRRTEGPDRAYDVRDERVATSLGITCNELEGIDLILEEGSSRPSEQIERWSWQRSWFPIWWWDTPSAEMLDADSIFRDALDVAKTIAAISESAVRWRIPIRWFDFEEFEHRRCPSGGVANLLEPVCAVEVHITRTPPTPKFAMMLAFSLRLSKQNVESLVFYRPETDAEPPVLFVGDSRLSFGVSSPTEAFELPSPAPKGVVAVSAPHHGSRVNDYAYQVINQWLGVYDGEHCVYVRNGGQSNQKLGAFLKQANRACVRCRGCSAATAASVTLNSENGKWIWPCADVPDCGC